MKDRSPFLLAPRRYSEPSFCSHQQHRGPVWETATPQERKEIYQLVLEAVYVDVLEKRLVEVVPKGAFAPLFGDNNLR